MGPLPDRSRLGPVEMRVVEEVDLGDVVRRKIVYGPEPGDLVPAYLMLPKEAAGASPAMMCLHQTVPIGKEEPVGLGRQAQPALRHRAGAARLRHPVSRLPELRRVRGWTRTRTATPARR